MECPHPKVAGTLHTHLPGNTLLHFTSCLIGKCECKNVPGLVIVFQQISYFVGQHTSFSRTRTGYHQRRTVVVEHRSTLSFIQFLYIIGHIPNNLSGKVLCKDRKRFGHQRTIP